jgi:hypothetical protein
MGSISRFQKLDMMSAAVSVMTFIEVDFTVILSTPTLLRARFL